MFNLKKTIQLLKLLYPKYLLLLVLFPVLIGNIIAFEASDKFGVFINLLWIPIIALPYFIFKKRIFYHLMVFMYFVTGLVEVSHWLIIKGPTTVASLFMIFNTNSIELGEFLNVKTTPWLLLLVPYTFIFILTIKNPPILLNAIYKKVIIVIAIALGGLFTVLSESAFIAELTPRFNKVLHAFASDFRKYNKAVKDNIIKRIEIKQSIDVKKQLFVLIIGESASRNHMSIYGYDLKTNPKLELRDDLIVFDDVISGYSNTIEGVMSIITESDLQNELPYYQSKDLIDAFHSMDFKTYWISNQIPFGWAENLISAIGSKSDNTEFVNLSGNSTYEGNKNSSLDEKLLLPFYKALKDDVDKKFIILHLMGNHLDYKKRYPSQFQIFEGKDHKSKMRAQYANSILYNDYVMDSIFSLMSDHSAKIKNQLASAVYVSDHGENVYDAEGILGHHFVNKLHKPNVEIPMIVWLSPTFRQLDTVKTDLIEKRKNIPYVSDDMFHSILDLNFVQSSVFDASRSVFHIDFDKKRPRILTDGENYDNN